MVNIDRHARLKHKPKRRGYIVFAHRVLDMHGNRRPPLRLPPEIEARLDALARKTGRSKSYYAREAILRQIEDIEDD